MTLDGTSSDIVPNINVHEECCIFNEIAIAGQMNVAEAYTERKKMPAPLENIIPPKNRSGPGVYSICIYYTCGSPM